MKVLVTGADGFIGSHLTELLVREGYDVRAMVIYNSSILAVGSDPSPPMSSPPLTLWPETYAIRISCARR